MIRFLNRTLGIYFMVAQIATAAECKDINGAEVSDASAYLQRDRSTLLDGCILQALTRLQTVADVEGIGLLVKYLDFQRPLTGLEKRGIFLRPLTTYELFPAVTNLFVIGKSAIPNLLSLIGQGGGSNLARRNAVETIMLILKSDEPAGVALLNEASRSSTDVIVSRHIFEAALLAVERCAPRDRVQCGAALDGTSRP